MGESVVAADGTGWCSCALLVLAYNHVHPQPIPVRCEPPQATTIIAITHIIITQDSRYRLPVESGRPLYLLTCGQHSPFKAHELRRHNKFKASKTNIISRLDGPPTPYSCDYRSGLDLHSTISPQLSSDRRSGTVSIDSITPRLSLVFPEILPSASTTIDIFCTRCSLLLD
ncbi:hypothetical protein FA15DRAFT_60419 [Coprinopsis marcescibilis]|uniref:Uncharacterized protein n=1 Tax=Coprinopsis marcescibilis TaxID=230819 RepID=A0A5C3L8Q3_COPMA|nr:hypothetical protein FA15DRAFT_60419 [Coprinopsis marcescibilis]